MIIYLKNTYKEIILSILNNNFLKTSRFKKKMGLIHDSDISEALALILSRSFLIWDILLTYYSCYLTPFLNNFLPVFG